MVFSELDLSVSRLESVNPEIVVEGKNVFVFSFSSLIKFIFSLPNSNPESQK